MKTPKCPKVPAWQCPYCQELHSSEAAAIRCRDQAPILLQVGQLLVKKSQKGNKTPIYWYVAQIDHPQDVKKGWAHQPEYSLVPLPVSSGQQPKEIKNAQVPEYEVLPRIPKELTRDIGIIKTVYA